MVQAVQACPAKLFVDALCICVRGLTYQTPRNFFAALAMSAAPTRPKMANSSKKPVPAAEYTLLRACFAANFVALGNP
jgi:hypothetical protein